MDLDLLRDLVLRSAQALILLRHEQLSDEKLDRAVDLMLLGAFRRPPTRGHLG